MFKKIKDWWNQIFGPQEIEYYVVDWDKVRTVKDLIFITRHSEPTKNIYVGPGTVENIPHWKNLTRKVTVEL